MSASLHFSDMPRLRCPLIGGKADLTHGRIGAFLSCPWSRIRVIRMPYEIHQ